MTMKFRTFLLAAYLALPTFPVLAQVWPPNEPLIAVRSPADGFSVFPPGATRLQRETRAGLLSGALTSFTFSAPSPLSCTPTTALPGSPTITCTWSSLAQGQFLASPSSGSGALTPRAITTADLAAALVTYAKIQNVSTNNRLLGRATAGAGSIEEIALGSGLTITSGTLNVASGAGGTVTSVALTVPSWLASSGGPVTGSGTLAIAPAPAQTSGRVIGTCGAGTAVSLCALVADDLPTVTAAKGGTGIDTSASTGVPRISSGTWTANAGLSHLASSTSADLAGVVSDETGSGPLVFRASPTLTDATANQVANGDAAITSTRFTDSSPSGSFSLFKSAAGATLWNVDITGSLAAGTVPVARVTGLAASATTDTTSAANITSGTLGVARGGTGVGSLTAHGVVIGNGTSAAAVTAPGTIGQVLTSSGSSADPAFQTITTPPPAPIYKPADQTINNSATLTSDNDLGTTLASGKKYFFIFRCHIFDGSSSAAGGFKVSLGGGFTATNLVAEATILSNLNTNYADTERWTAAGQTAAAAADPNLYLVITGTVEVNSGGSMTLRWSQLTATNLGTGVSVLRGSTLEYREIP